MVKRTYCPYRKDCITRPRELPLCIPDYKNCLVYQYAQDYELEAEMSYEEDYILNNSNNFENG